MRARGTSGDFGVSAAGAGGGIVAKRYKCVHKHQNYAIASLETYLTEVSWARGPPMDGPLKETQVSWSERYFTLTTSSSNSLRIFEGIAGIASL